MSACGKFSSPARLEADEKQGHPPLVNCSMIASRLWLCPVSLTPGQATLFQLDLDQRGSTGELRELNKARRPSASISGNSVINRSNLADVLTCRAASSGSSWGDSTPGRSLSSASRMVICDLASPLFWQRVTHGFPSPAGWFHTNRPLRPAEFHGHHGFHLGGSSAATSALVLRSMKGVMRAQRSCAMRVLSPCFSMGVRKHLLKRSWLPQEPRHQKVNRP